MDFRIRCAELECGYRGHPVLRDISLTFKAGESVALLGKNGSGKTTLLKTLAGDLLPLAGEIEISVDGASKKLSALSPIDSAKLISVVPQEEATPFAFTVIETVTMGRLARSGSIFDSREDVDLAWEAMRRAGCDHLATRSVTELSGGEKQRVLVARALAQDTPIVLLDEPSSHLDPPHQLAMAEFIALLAEEGKCAITAVHDLNSASVLSRRCVLIGEGKILADGETEAVLESDALEHCYQAKFERVRSKSGRLVVIPERTGLSS